MRKTIIALAVIIVIFLIGGTGCLMNSTVSCSSGRDNRNINDIALDHMEQKYGEPFTYGAPWGISKLGAHELLVTCESLPDQMVFVEIENYRDDNRIFRDNFLAVKYRDEVNSFLHEQASIMFGDVNVFYEVAMQSLSPDLPANATFNEYFTDTSGFISACIELRAGSFSGYEHVEEMIGSILAKSGAGNITLRVIFVDDDTFGTFDENDLREKVIRHQFIHCARVTRSGDGEYIEWLG